MPATAQLHAWCRTSLSLTARELLVRLQAEAPSGYPETLLQTLQRRVQDRRAEVARAGVRIWLRRDGWKRS